MKRENIIRRSLKEIWERRRKGTSEVDREYVDAMTADDIERLALKDNRRNRIDDDWTERAVRILSGDERRNVVQRDLERDARVEDSEG